MGGISIWQLLIIFVIVILLFGTKKLRTLGSDLGSAVKGFKKAVNENEASSDADFKEKQEVEDKSASTTAKTESAEQQKQQ